MYHCTTKLSFPSCPFNQVITCGTKRTPWESLTAVAVRKTARIQGLDCNRRRNHPPLSLSTSPDDRPTATARHFFTRLPHRSPPRPRPELLFLSIHPHPLTNSHVSVCVERERGGRGKSSRSRGHSSTPRAAVSEKERRVVREGAGGCRASQPATSTAAGGRAVREASSAPPCIWIRRPRAAARRRFLLSPTWIGDPARDRLLVVFLPRYNSIGCLIRGKKIICIHG